MLSTKVFPLTTECSSSSMSRRGKHRYSGPVHPFATWLYIQLIIYCLVFFCEMCVHITAIIFLWHLTVFPISYCKALLLEQQIHNSQVQTPFRAPFFSLFLWQFWVLIKTLCIVHSIELQNANRARVLYFYFVCQQWYSKAITQQFLPCKCNCSSLLLLSPLPSIPSNCYPHGSSHPSHLHHHPHPVPVGVPSGFEMMNDGENQC